MSEARVTGRPPIEYDPEKALHICVELAMGRPLTKIVKDDGMPGIDTVYRWLRENESFAEEYARAREDQADTMADEVTTIADEDPATIMEKARDGSDDTIIRVDSAAVQHQKLRVDARKWVAAKLKPRKYGEKLDVTSEGKRLEAGGTTMYLNAGSPEEARRIVAEANKTK